MAFNSNEDGRYTLKDLLEIPELQHPPLLNRPNLKKGEVSLGYGITSAFLGPNLWNTSQVGGPDNGEFSLQYMDLDEFLSENGIPSTELKKDDGQQILDSPEPKRAVTPTEDYIQLQTAPAAPLPQNGGFSPKNSPIHGYEGVHEASPPYYNTETFRIPPSKHTDSSNGPSLPPQQLQDKDPSTQPTTITDTADSLRRQGETCQTNINQPSLRQGSPVIEYDLNPNDLALASIPGHENFDPRKCKFTDDELKPQPIIKKSRKVFVPEDCKDEKYWMRRTKNNIAAQRSREARRIKENQIALRAAFLEKENNALKDEVKMIKEENTKLLKKLSQYEKAV
ncbi:thyrotroph embryonic factor-like isoform X2 [Ostrea edulis]|uniref:thyrotroph embryonic factor-like isoform X2 n=1 Tax=Ostrea edulis TaxID=37623 RepID=UPI002095B5D5|nr:thyrotroph embryonic factor-like isoform X2 [Ostrea edulis]